MAGPIFPRSDLPPALDRIYWAYPMKDDTLGFYCLSPFLEAGLRLDGDTWRCGFAFCLACLCVCVWGWGVGREGGGRGRGVFEFVGLGLTGCVGEGVVGDGSNVMVD